MTEHTIQRARIARATGVALLLLGGVAGSAAAESDALPGGSAWGRDRVLIGAYKLAYPDSTPLADLKQEVDDLQGLGFDFAYFDVWGVPGADALQPLLDYADERRFSLVPHINACLAPLRELDAAGKAQWKKTPEGATPPEGAKPYIYGIGEESWAQRWRDGSIVYEGAWRGRPFPYPDMWAPAARNSFRQAVRDTAELLASHPSVGLISYDDEYRYWFDFMGDRGIPVFSPWSQRMMSLAPGETQVPEDYLAPGHVAGKGDDFVGVRYTTGYQFYDFTDPSLDFHVSDLSRTLNGHARGVGDFFTTGAYGADSTWVLARAYATERNDPPLADVFSVELAERMARDDAALAVLLGWWQSELNTPYYNRRLALATRLAMMQGPRAIVIAPTHALRSVAEFRQTLKEVIGEIESMGPLLQRLELKTPRVGLLWSDTTLSYQQLGESNWQDSPAGSADRNWRWEEHKLSAHIAYSALCRAGFRPRVITERDVLNGVLDELDALVLANHQYSETRLVREYDGFAERGGLVVVDRSTAVKPKRAKQIESNAAQWCRAMEAGKRDWWSRDPAAHLSTYRTAQELIAEMADDFRAVLPSRLRVDVEKDSTSALMAWKARAAGADYLCLINSDLESAVNNKLLVDHRGPVYDLTSGGRAVAIEQLREKAERAWTVSLDPAAWSIWLLADRPLETIKAVLVTGEAPAAIRCQLWDDEGFPMRGIVPVVVRWKDRVFHGVAEHGVAMIWIPEEIGPGEQLRVEALGMTADVAAMPAGTP